MSRPQSMAEKILQSHLAGGTFSPGALCTFHVDSVLFHDMSGILALMAFDAMGQKKAGVPLPLVFTDHNLLGAEAQTANDQAFVKSCAQAFGLRYARAGSGICHSLFSERFARPGMLLIGADSHSASCGALGMLGIGMGGMETAAAMTGKPFPLRCPRVIRVAVEGRLRPGVSAMDAALWLLARMTVKGAVNSILEYTGEGVSALSVPDRQTLANLGAEMGATSSIFPADRQVLSFLRAQGREGDFRPLAPDSGAVYDREISLDLSGIEPMAALPGRPDRGVKVKDAGRPAFSQVFIGSCANGSYGSIARAALVLKGRKVAPDTALVVSCGSRAVYRQLMRDGYLDMLLASGARLLECGCGPCMGIGQAPEGGTNTLRTANRNFPGRSGTRDAQIFLAGPETAAASAATGCLTAAEEIMDVSLLGAVGTPESCPADDSAFLPFDLDWQPGRASKYNAAIQPIPTGDPIGDACSLTVSLKAGDGVSTDDIVPAVPQALTLRANIPALSQYIFANLDPGFAARARALGSSMIVAGEDYAQGSSREHAAAGCLALGVKAVLVKSMHRIHRANLINYGVVPLFFDDPADLARIEAGDRVTLTGLREGILAGKTVCLRNETRQTSIPCHTDLNDHERGVLLSGGLLNAMRQGGEGP